MKRCYKVALGMVCALVLMGCGAKEEAEEVVVIEQVEETVESEPVETENVDEKNDLEEKSETIPESEEPKEIETEIIADTHYIVKG